MCASNGSYLLRLVSKHYNIIRMFIVHTRNLFQNGFDIIFNFARNRRRFIIMLVFSTVVLCSIPIHL